MRSFPIYSEDLNVFKVFTLPNGQRIRFETSFGNLFNRTLFGEPANNWSAANFGQVFSQATTTANFQVPTTKGSRSRQRGGRRVGWAGW